MSQKYKKIGVTTDGYRGERTVLKERVIEGLIQPTFQNSILQLTPESEQTQYLTTNNTSTGYFIVLPKASELWNNWQVAIINNSAVSVNIYYYTEDPTVSANLHLFKEVSAGNMLTAILLDNTSDEGIWTNLRTIDTVSDETIEKYTSNIFETYEIPYNQLTGASYYCYKPETGDNVYTIDSPIGRTSILYDNTLQALDPQPEFTINEDTDLPSITINDVVYTYYEDGNITPTLTNASIPLSMIPATSAVRSIYFKPIEQFTGSTTLTMSIGTETEDDLFYEDIDITGAVSNTNFGKDLFERILSNDSDLQLFATFNGTNLNSLTAGKIKIVIERQKLIDPTILKNAIVNTTVPNGSIFNYAFANIPAGYVRLDGSEIADAANTIPQFVEFLNKQNNQMIGEKLIVGIDEWNSINNTYGSCGKFAWNGGKLRFPKINCFIRGTGLNISNLGKFVDDTVRAFPNYKLPGSDGSGGGNNWNNGIATTDGEYDQSILGFDSAGHGRPIKIDYSILGPNYNGKETAPKHILYPYIMAVSNKIQWTSQIDYDNLIAASVYKADTNLSNINTTTDILNNSLPVNMDYIIESWRDGVNWYRIYKSGWVEQGGIADNGSVANSWNKTITLDKPMADDNYFFSVNAISTNPTQCGAIRTSTTITLYSTRDGGSAGTRYMIWEVKGYKA